VDFLASAGSKNTPKDNTSNNEKTTDRDILVVPNSNKNHCHKILFNDDHKVIQNFLYSQKIISKPNCGIELKV
jgi:hypothetical protein